jgi:hypothetical protein
LLFEHVDREFPVTELAREVNELGRDARVAQIDCPRTLEPFESARRVTETIAEDVRGLDEQSNPDLGGVLTAREIRSALEHLHEPRVAFGARREAPRRCEGIVGGNADLDGTTKRVSCPIGIVETALGDRRELEQEIDTCSVVVHRNGMVVERARERFEIASVPKRVSMATLKHQIGRVMEEQLLEGRQRFTPSTGTERSIRVFAPKSLLRDEIEALFGAAT